MARIPPFDPIAYLVSRKFPTPLSAMALKYGEHGNALILALSNNGDFPTSTRANALLAHGSTNPEFRAYLRAVDSYRLELQRKPQEDINALVITEKEKQRQEVIERSAKEESSRKYAQPSTPDYNHYCRCAYWTIDEAVALSFGRDPTKISAKEVKPYAGTSPIAREYYQRWTQAQRAVAMGQLWDRVMPGIFIPWATNNGIEMPSELLAHALNRGIPLQNWQNMYEALVEQQKKRETEVKEVIAKWDQALKSARAETAELKARLKAQTAQSTVQSPSPPSDPDELTTVTRKNMLKLIVGMGVCGYSFDPRSERNKATADIAGDLDRLGIGMTPETVLKYLKEGAKLLTPSAIDTAKRKRKSDKDKPKSS
mgnify:CR=1 FL=1